MQGGASSPPAASDASGSTAIHSFRILPPCEPVVVETTTCRTNPTARPRPAATRTRYVLDTVIGVPRVLAIFVNEAGKLSDARNASSSCGSGTGGTGRGSPASASKTGKLAIFGLTMANWECTVNRGFMVLSNAGVIPGT